MATKVLVKMAHLLKQQKSLSPAIHSCNKYLLLKQQNFLQCSLSKIDKFNYLNSLLEGSAAAALQGLSLTEGNYDDALDILKTRFGNPQQIITGHMEELLKLPDCLGDKAPAL